MEEKSRGCCDDSCTSDSCGGCSHSAGAPAVEKANAASNVKKVIGVVSGKGGVGKSLVTSMLASAMNRKGLKTAIMDADVTGPSIPKIFGLSGRLRASEGGIIPGETGSGIRVVSANLLLEDVTDPLIWRGAMIANMVKQFWTDVMWGDVDIMFIDMPPGTGDVPLTVFQFLPVDGIVIVTSPQELVSMIVAKAVKMADTMNVPVYGIVENLSYIKCPGCGEEIKIFGGSHVDEAAEKYGIKNVAKIPMDPKIAEACDKGCIESIGADMRLDSLADVLIKIPEHAK